MLIMLVMVGRVSSNTFGAEIGKAKENQAQEEKSQACCSEVLQGGF